MDEATRLKEALRDILECEQDFYTEGQGKFKRLPAALREYAGPLSVIFRTAREALKEEDEKLRKG